MQYDPEHLLSFRSIAKHTVLILHRHENGVEEWMAFFDDVDGKPLAIMSQVAPK